MQSAITFKHANGIQFEVLKELPLAEENRHKVNQHLAEEADSERGSRLKAGVPPTRRGDG